MATLTALSVRDVTFTYRRSDEDEGHPAVSNASFDVAAGSLTVITGEIGSGKRTLLQVVVGLLDADSGEIYWNGAPVEELRKSGSLELALTGQKSEPSTAHR